MKALRDIEEMCQLISDAIATSNLDWQHRPGVDVYTMLLAGGCTAISNSGLDNSGAIFKSLGTLLLSIEKLIRDPKTTLDEREGFRKHRAQCFWIFENEFLELGITWDIRL